MNSAEGEVLVERGGVLVEIGGRNGRIGVKVYWERVSGTAKDKI